MGDEELLAVVRHLLNGQPHGGDRHVDDQIDVIGVVPLPRDPCRDIGFDLMIGGNHRDRLAQHLAAEIVDRHLRGGDRSETCRRRGRSGQVGQHTDLHCVIGKLGERKSAGKDDRNCKASEPYTTHVFLPLRFTLT